MTNPLFCFSRPVSVPCVPACRRQDSVANLAFLGELCAFCVLCVEAPFSARRGQIR